jgi:glycosyltransferase involved in cell wall biosynthesis
VRVALIYDCLYPLTIGGGERWYRFLADALVDAGASVTYLTRRQWDESEPPRLPGIDVVAVSRRDDLYDDRGVRRLAPGLRFGAGVFRYLVRHRQEFQVVQLANFPFWSMVGARAALAGSGVPVITDWHEVWSLRFWRSYAGALIGSAGFAVQRLCIALTTFALVSSRSNARRLVAAGLKADPVVIAGYLPPEAAGRQGEAEPAHVADPAYVLFAGRHIFDKGIDLLPGLAHELARRGTGVKLVIAGDGPGRPGLEAALGSDPSTAGTALLGFVPDDELAGLMREAACVVVPSRREGYGMVVVEATSHGTPVVVADFEENLATEHVEAGRNGYVASPPTAERLAAQVALAIEGGMGLRRSTLGWYREAARTKTIDHSLRQAVACYAELLAAGR